MTAFYLSAMRASSCICLARYYWTSDLSLVRFHAVIGAMRLLGASDVEIERAFGATSPVRRYA